MNEAEVVALQQARELLDGGLPGPAAGEALPLAWALKDLCYEAWTQEPARVARAAAALRALVDAGVSQGETVEITALADWTEGIASLTRGQMPEAIAALDRACAGLRQAGRPDPAAQTQVPKIMALSMLGQHDQAALCGEATQRELVTLGNVAAAARVSQNLGSLQLFRDMYHEAARHFREAAVLSARLRDHGHSVLADIGLGDTLTAMGDFDEAGRIYARARMRAGNQGLDLQLALVDESQALLDLARGRYRQALAGFESARRRFEALAMPQYLAVAEKQLADAYLELRLLPEALALFETAVGKFRALGLAVDQAWALTQQGRTQARLGHQAADDAFTEAAALFAAQDNTVGVAAVALARAELSLAAGDAAAALQWAGLAGDGYAAARQADGRARAEVVRAEALLACGRGGEAADVFERTLASARELRQLQVQVRCLTGRGLAALAAGRQRGATEDFEAAIELFEDQRKALPGDEIRSAFLTDHLRPYQERLRMALDAGVAGDVLHQLDRFRARALDDHWSEEIAPEFGDAIVARRERLNWLYRRVQRLQDEDAPSAALHDEIVRAENELLEHARRQRLSGPLPSASLAGEPMFSVAALQAILGDGEALVEYGVQDDELFACVATRERVTLVRRLSGWTQTLEAVRALRFQIETLRHGTAPVRRHVVALTARAQARLASLHALIWAPLRPALAGARRVLVVPQGPLANVPFAALSDLDRVGDAAVELALAPSARAALRGLRRPPLAARSALAVGESSRLPHAAAEAHFVAGLFEQGRACVAEAASLKSLQAHAAAADVLHLACHAQFRSDNPRFSALHLFDGALTVELAEALPLRAITVVLSACETGVAEDSTGDEMVGLVRAFLVAGASRVVASLWPVDDEVTLAFMGHFYGAMVSGLGPAAALCRAQQATRQTHPHPYFWAAFSLQGGW